MRAFYALLAIGTTMVLAGAGDARADGGNSFQIIDTYPLFTTPNAADHINFPFVSRFDDGTMWMFYTQGRHLIDPETSFSKISTDNGLTWSDAVHPQSPSNVHQFAPGNGAVVQGQEMRIVSASIAPNSNYSTQQELYLNRWISPQGSNQPLPGGSGRYVNFPFAIKDLTAHRSMVELDNGYLVQSLYGQAQGDSKARSLVIRSTDKGESWEYLSTIGYTSTSTEGFVEPEIIKLGDGSLLAMMRTGGNSAIWQARSTDGGATWFDHHEITEQFGTVDPDMLLTQNGVLLATAGRPGGQYLLVDYTGTGNNWEEHTILDPSHSGSGYASLVEYEPNKVMMFYTWSGFWNDDLPTNELPNRLMVTRFSVVPEPQALLLVLAAGPILMTRRSR